MIIIPQTPITDTSFEKWKCHKLEVNDNGDMYYYYVIPLVEVDEDEMQDLEYLPKMLSSESGEFTDEKDSPIYTIRLFDDDLPELEFEEEVEILYKILTKKDIFLK
jgi:hypothetical protein